jgi:hypothetical protein
MDKKIISLSIILIIFLTIAVTIIYLNQQSESENQYGDNIETIDEEDIENEFNDFFLDEDDEVEIGEMI